VTALREQQLGTPFATMPVFDFLYKSQLINQMAPVPEAAQVSGVHCRSPPPPLPPPPHLPGLTRTCRRPPPD
jgi:hypothetical protein